MIRSFSAALIGAILSLSVVAPAAAQKAPPAPPPAAPRAPAIHVAPAAADAVRVLDTFMGALVAGQLDAARRFMTPDAVLLADGAPLGQRDEYFATRARNDATRLGSSERTLLRREARGGPNLAWVVSEKVLRSRGEGTSSGLHMVETVLLVKTLEGWKIAHVHWSSNARRG
jgi:ketosteroid isomerase-like protein